MVLYGCADCGRGWSLDQLYQDGLDREVVYQCPNCYQVLFREWRESDDVSP